MTIIMKTKVNRCTTVLLLLPAGYKYNTEPNGLINHTPINCIPLYTLTPRLVTQVVFMFRSLKAIPSSEMTLWRSFSECGKPNSWRIRCHSTSRPTPAVALPRQFRDTHFLSDRRSNLTCSGHIIKMFMHARQSNGSTYTMALHDYRASFIVS